MADGVMASAVWFDFNCVCLTLWRSGGFSGLPRAAHS